MEEPLQKVRGIFQLAFPQNNSALLTATEPAAVLRQFCTLGTLESASKQKMSDLGNFLTPWSLALNGLI
jgi:hypothetical protein